MIIKIARKEAIDKYPNLPLREWISDEEGYDDSYFPQTFANYVLTLPSKSYIGHIKLLGKELTALTKSFGFDKLIFLGDIDIAWLKRNIDFKQAKEALQYLADNKIGKRFNGALQVDLIQLSNFMVQLAWLVRTNAILPYVYCIDPDQNFIASICQYGNLHFSTLNELTDKVLVAEISKTKFEFMNEDNCYNKFEKTKAIKGIQITL